MWSHLKLPVGLCLFCFLQSLHALESDRLKPINITSDRITVDQKKGFSHYQGNVILTQGTLKVTGSDVTIYLEKKQLRQIIIIGNPATLKQKPAEDQPEINSRAGRMEYDLHKDMLLLTDNAQVEQGQNRFSGDYIRYNTRTSVVRARQDADKKTRVNITIVPEKEAVNSDSTP
jgi:lipopolysaccharide export system protein LptA